MQKLMAEKKICNVCTSAVLMAISHVNDSGAQLVAVAALLVGADAGCGSAE